MNMVGTGENLKLVDFHSQTTNRLVFVPLIPQCPKPFKHRLILRIPLIFDAIITCFSMIKHTFTSSKVKFIGNNHSFYAITFNRSTTITTCNMQASTFNIAMKFGWHKPQATCNMKYTKMVGLEKWNNLHFILVLTMGKPFFPTL